MIHGEPASFELGVCDWDGRVGLASRFDSGVPARIKFFARCVCEHFLKHVNNELNYVFVTLGSQQ